MGDPSIVTKYSDYIEHPVVMDIKREKEDPADKEKKIKVTEEETMNARKAIWLKDPSEVKPEEYNEFYKHVSHDYHRSREGDPLPRRGHVGVHGPALHSRSTRPTASCTGTSRSGRCSM